MQEVIVKVSPSEGRLPKESQLAWYLAEIGSGSHTFSPQVIEMVINRVIDNASVALAAINRGPVACARAQALCHSRAHGATVFGLDKEVLVCAEWAAWANGTAVRELDMHDTFLAADYSHPADSIPPITAVAQQCGRSGSDLVRGIVVAYEVHVALVKAICLHEYKKDHVAHLAAAQVAGIGALLGLSSEVIFQAIQHAVHVSFSTRQSRKGEISSWKAFAPAHTGKLAIEAIDRAMRGEQGPSPIYEGEDSVIAYMLGGVSQEYRVVLPEPKDELKAILETYTKEHSAEYQAQALIDLAFRMRKRIQDFSKIDRIIIHTSHHTHFVIGTGAGDPQKFDPKASRETLDHSIMYIFTVALQDGSWHHVDSYSPERASREDTVNLWKKVETREDPEWTARYHDSNHKKKAFGGRVEIIFNDGSILDDSLAIAHAHAEGEHPFERKQYEHKFKTLTQGVVSELEGERFLGLARRLNELSAEEVRKLNVVADLIEVVDSQRNNQGVF